MMAFLLKNISTLLTLGPAALKEGRRIIESDLGILHKQSILIEKDRIAWIGEAKKLPRSLAQKKSLKEIDMKGMTVLPGFVECHTHSIFAGDRFSEFELRNQGHSYQEIAAQGGGILSTMRNTRAATLKSLISIGQKRADHFLRQGVTTLEIKSGYALNLDDELKCLRAIQKIQKLRVVPTFLGAHALPPEFKTYESYLDFLAEKVLPEVKKKKLARRVDIFIEQGFFPKQASEKYLSRAKALGFEISIHADQLTLSGGSEAAIKLGALSADHLLQITSREIKSLAESQVTCVMLPTADLYTRTKYPPAKELIEAGARLALATDFNPGTSPTQDLTLVGLLARLEMKMTLPQVIAAYTVGAAYALNLQSEVGSLEVGKSADLLCDEQDWQSLFYSVGEQIPKVVFSAGARNP
jgi:imidazolonepropionase